MNRYEESDKKSIVLQQAGCDQGVMAEGFGPWIRALYDWVCKDSQFFGLRRGDRIALLHNADQTYQAEHTF